MSMTNELKAYVSGFAAAIGMANHPEFLMHEGCQMHILRVHLLKQMINEEELADLAAVLDEEMLEILKKIPMEELGL